MHWEADTSLIDAARDIAPIVQKHNPEAERERRLSLSLTVRGNATGRSVVGIVPQIVCPNGCLPSTDTVTLQGNTERDPFWSRVRVIPHNVLHTHCANSISGART
jgi:hypothetical protein